ncbi:NlpC/P60 family protein [Clostridium estertheticum]|uniref:C40 family peptidase n=1 Tax=Clostridium estertheticum TaxID=238834 RepID=UPI001C6F2FE7|nr:C40 family peptidase [Clostridium estertheticum]MBW9151693.1 C40 family peptidase [Clostridium estertheticum]WLC83184.1 C40 family peptidase [Clostridium estertheticum]
MMRRKILPLLIAIGLTMSVSMPTIAAPLSQQQDSYALAQKNLEKLEISIETLDFNIENIYSGIDKAKYDISSTQKKIDQNTKDILVAQSNIKEEQVLFNERMRSMYMNGAGSYVEILLDSKGVGDLISRVENIKNIVEYDNKIIKGLNDKKESIEVTQKALNANKVKVLALKANNENKLDKLSAEKRVQSKLIVESKKQQELHKVEIAQTSKQDVVMNTQSVKQITPSRGNVVREVEAEPSTQASAPQQSSSTSSNAIIEYAKTFLGTPYQWGANGPNTFDCSGFTKYVYAHFGIGMGRTTYDQITQGKYVSRGNLQAGDLVFFGTGSPHHVGIYVGNGSYIHAPQTGDVVKISQMTRSDYMSARRFK